MSVFTPCVVFQKIEKMKGRLHLLEAAETPKNKHTIFKDSRRQGASASLYPGLHELDRSGFLSGDQTSLLKDDSGKNTINFTVRAIPQLSPDTKINTIGDVELDLWTFSP